MAKLQTFEEGIAHLTYLRDGFTDEIPERVIHGREFRVKARKNWFQGVTATLENILDDAMISNADTRIAVEDFIIFATSKEFKKRLTRKEDIDQANSVINLVLKETV